MKRITIIVVIKFQIITDSDHIGIKLGELSFIFNQIRYKTLHYESISKPEGIVSYVVFSCLVVILAIFCNITSRKKAAS
jgi:hypothetical protein